MSNYHKFAFTLAEVLITLGVIGVVAVLTVPNLMTNYQEKVLDSQSKKVENELSNAFAMLMVNEEVDSLYDSSLYVSTIDEDSVDNSVGNFVGSYIKASKICGYTDAQTDCTKGTFLYTEENSQEDFPGIESYCGNLKSGATFCMSPFSSTEAALVYVDLNAAKTPNKSDKDILFYGVSSDATMTRISYRSPDMDGVLVSYGTNKLGVIKTTREVTGLGLGDAKAFVESAPVVMKESISKEECLSLKDAFEADGATFECRYSAKKTVAKKKKVPAKRVVE